MSEVKLGKRFCLSLPLDLPGASLSPRRKPPRLRSVDRGGFPGMNFTASNENPVFNDVVSDDIAEIWLQYSTQWDSLAHVGSEFDLDGTGESLPAYYNGFRAGRDIVAHAGDREATAGKPSGALRLGVENMAEACIQGRGVMIDLEAHFGRNRRVVTFDDLASVMESDGIEVAQGDMVCLHTGYAALVLDEAAGRIGREALRDACCALDGRDPRLQDWITRTGLVALVSDNFAVESLPARPGAGERWSALPLHEHCLFRLGVYLGELWHLSELARWLRTNGRSRFLLTAPPLRLPGAVGSPVTPVATV